MWLALFTLLSSTAVSAMLAWKRLSNSTSSFAGNQNDLDGSSASQVSAFNGSHGRALDTLLTSTANSIKREPSGSRISQETEACENNSEVRSHTRSLTTAASTLKDASFGKTSLDSVPTSYDEENNFPTVHSDMTSQEIRNPQSITTKHLNEGVPVSSNSISALTDTLYLHSTSVVSTDEEPMVKIVNKAEAVSASRPRDVIVANTSKGTVVGRKRKLLGKEVAVFLGIPYAVDTGGSNRFSASRPVDRWNSALDASKARAPCYQSPQSILDERPSGADHENSSSYAPPASEDCLHANVWAPICNSSYCSGLTVIVFFHGGGLRVGANTDRQYEGSVLAVRGSVVVVVPNYRLGVFGFPSRDITGAARNPGLLDLNMAVRWVRDNAAAFGGSADDIVLFGSGWGSYLAGLFLVSPKLRAHFGVSRAILGSGSPLLKSSHEQHADDHWSGFLAAVGCYETEESERLACLRNATASSLAATQDRFPGVVGLLFPDDLVLPEPPSEFVAESRAYTSTEALVTNVMSEGRAQYQRLFASRSAGLDPSVESLMNAVGLAPVQLAYSNHVELQGKLARITFTLLLHVRAMNCVRPRGLVH
ncbi:hypothetical protein V5799_030913 [Amblyomma americanum]|uniref:Carboxylesterase type B domain-containing protein n=1 Tax=Amblyomma americanum TaxID=6943 RepID=A0AAQ4EMS8_AMBAM